MEFTLATIFCGHPPPTNTIMERHYCYENKHVYECSAGTAGCMDNAPSECNKPHSDELESYVCPGPDGRQYYCPKGMPGCGKTPEGIAEHCTARPGRFEWYPCQDGSVIGCASGSRSCFENSPTRCDAPREVDATAPRLYDDGYVGGVYYD